MVRRFEKDILRVGNWHLPDGRVFRATPERVRHLGQRLSEMLQAGLQIPLAFEHQEATGPMTADEAAAALRAKVQRTLGHAMSAKLDEDGETILGLFEVPVDADGDSLLRNRFVSPEVVQNFRDGNGRVWPGESISHVAVTPRPVQHRQSAAVEVAALSHGRRLRYPVRLSWDAYQPTRLSSEDAPVNAKTDADLAGEDLAGRTMATPAEPEKAELQEAIEALAGVGLHLPKGTDRDNILHAIIAAARTAAGGEDEDQDQDEDQGAGAEPVEIQTPYLMSHSDDPYTQAQLDFGDDLARRAGCVGKRPAAALSLHRSPEEEAGDDLARRCRVG